MRPEEDVMALAAMIVRRLEEHGCEGFSVEFGPGPSPGLSLVTLEPREWEVTPKLVELSVAFDKRGDRFSLDVAMPTATQAADFAVFTLLRALYREGEE